MAILILNGDEKLEDVSQYCNCYDSKSIKLDEIDVIIQQKGKETEVLKSPFKKLDK